MVVQEDWTRLDSPKVEIDGQLVRQDIPRMRKRLLKIVGKRCVTSCELQLSGVSSMDTAGAAVLVELMRHLVLKKGTLRIVRPSECVVRMLHLTRLHDVLAIGHSKPR